MPVYIALLRGINVGGHKKIIMADLRNHFLKWGFKDVKTYIQSGNIIFTSEETKVEELSGRIRNGILNAYGFEIQVWVCERTKLNRIVGQNPYENANDAGQKVYFIFMTSSPDAELAARLQSVEFDNEEFTITRDCIFLYCKNGYGKAKCSSGFFETGLKVKTTARNNRTVNKLIELSGL
ncbi:MAG: DUF1697 domain-containing protein [Flavobacteriaceae bacterium]